MTREQKLQLVWSKTHSDFKGTYEDRRAIMVCRNGATVLSFLDELTDAEIDARLPKKAA